MLLVENKNNDPSWNLALEEHLLNIAGKDGIDLVMFWRNSPSVIIGCFQNAFEEVDLSAAEKFGVKVVRRSTGGGAVYHDLGNLNYSFLLSNKRLEDLDFALLSEPIVRALRKLGLPVTVSGRNDLLVDGRKFSGIAQRAEGSTLLHHGTIMHHVDLTKLPMFLQVDPAKFQSKGVKSIRSRVTNLSEHLPPWVDVTAIEEALTEEICTGHHRLTQEDFKEVQRIKEAKYGAWDWNIGNSPTFTVTRSQRFAWGQISLNFKVDDALVTEAKVFGDFFGQDLQGWEISVQNLPYDGAALKSSIVRLADYIEGAGQTDLMKLAEA
jgi:lipoate-protein ligase A